MFSSNEPRNCILPEYSLLSINILLFVMKILGASLMQVSTCFKSASLIHFRSAGKYGDSGVLPQSPSQSAPTILALKNWVGGGPEKNWVQNMGCKKQGAKNRVIINQKQKRLGCLFSF